LVAIDIAHDHGAVKYKSASHDWRRHR